MFDQRADALVNTVNCVGAMGKGVALATRQRYPAVYAHYLQHYTTLQPGGLLVCTRAAPKADEPKWVLNVATKRHWKNPSQMIWVEQGLERIREFVDATNARGKTRLESMVMPALGCGNGGLNWKDVLPRIRAVFDTHPCRVLLYPPAG